MEIGLLQTSVVKMRSYWSKMGPKSNVTGVLIGKGPVKIERHIGRTPHDYQGRGWNMQLQATECQHGQQASRVRFQRGRGPVAP